jgi:centrosomal protein CEP104
VDVEEFDGHVDEETCNPFKPEAKFNRCALCHEDIRPGEEGWKKHLLIDTCPNNERHP